MAYSHVTEEERKHIYEWRQDGLGFRVNGRSASMDAHASPSDSRLSSTCEGSPAHVPLSEK